MESYLFWPSLTLKINYFPQPGVGNPLPHTHMWGQQVYYTTPLTGWKKAPRYNLVKLSFLIAHFILLVVGQLVLILLKSTWRENSPSFICFRNACYRSYCVQCIHVCFFSFLFLFFNIFDLIIVNQNIQWNNKLLSVMQVVFSHFVCLHLVNHLAPILANLHSSACVFECYAHILQSNQQPMHKNKFRHSLFSCSIICCWICVTK